MTSEQTARDLVLTILELVDQKAPPGVVVGTVRRVLEAERARCAWAVNAEAERWPAGATEHRVLRHAEAAIRALP